jgi:hypothetical protein
MQLTTEQIIGIGQWVLLIVAVAVMFYMQYQQNKNIVAAFTQTIKDLQSNPVAMANAKAAGESIPQDAYVKFYGLVDGLIGLLGKDTEVGKLATEVKETAEMIDHDPANDPTTTTTTTTTTTATADPG